jgi:Skp family chaperone for outer membrane proteins
MKLQMKMVAAAILAASLVGTNAYAGDPPAPPAKKHAAKKPPKPTVEEQIDALRQEFQGQIDGLKSDLATKDAQLKQAQQAAADAQAAAQKAEADATSQQSALTENSAAVTTLQSTVTDMKASNASVVASFSDDAAAIKKAIGSPEVLHYKGITLSPSGSFLAAESVWRQGATGGDINTPFTGVPLNAADAHNISEFYGSGRQSRLALKAVGKLDNMTLTGYYEMDWLSAGVTSNNNQSNSYTMRQRQLWADAKLTNGWDFSGGQGWSLATETTQGLTRGTEILPATIDAQYEAGFVWARQYSFRVSKDFAKKFFAGISLENAEALFPSGSGLPTNLLIGSPGVGGGLYNLNANYSFNLTPDFIAKVAFEPGWGHWELFGIGRSFRDRIYPTTGSPYNDTKWGGGIGGGFRGPLAGKKVSIGLKGLYGEGVGRYGSSGIADITLRPDATIAPLHGFSALSTLEFNPNPRLSVYLNYGGDYIGRDYAVTSTGSQVGYGTYTTDMSGCNVEVKAGGSTSPSNPAKCGGNNKDVQEFTAGYWYNMYNGPKGRLRYGLQYSWFERDLWSGQGGATNPGGVGKGTDNMFWTSLRYYLP